MNVRALGAIAAGMLVLGSGCVTGDANKSTSNKPDVTKLGVLPPPEGVPAAPPAQGGQVVQAGGTQPAPVAPPPQAPTANPAPASGGLSLPKFALRQEKKVIATEMAVAWRSKIEYLPDPARNGVMGPGLAGQLFLFGGKKLEFAPADGVLTVDLVDETLRAPGQPPATPERWQFSKEMLNRLQTTDDTFGKSYVLFLPWPAYKPDITRVKISARYDQEHGETLFALPPSVVTITRDAPVFDHSKSSGYIGGPAVQPVPPNGTFGPQSQPNFPAPIPLGGPPPTGPLPQGVIPLGGSLPPTPGGVVPLGAFGPAPAGALPGGATGVPQPGVAPGVPGAGVVPAGPMPLAPPPPPGLLPAGMVR
jgi:hypothetical protein